MRWQSTVVAALVIFCPAVALAQAESEHIMGTELYLDRGGNVNAVYQTHASRLHFAAEKNFLKFARLLIGKRADLNLKDGKKNTPLHLAVAGGHIDMVKLLVEKGADTRARAEHLRTPLQAAYAATQPDICLFLITHDPKLNVKDPGNVRVFTSAARGGDMAIVKAFVEKGIDVNFTPDHMKRGALYYAAAFGRNDVVKYLLAHGGDPKTKDGWHITALAVAAAACSSQVVEQLIA